MRAAASSPARLAALARAAVGLRALVLVLACVAAPGGARLLEGALAAIADEACCDGACDEGDADCCPIACAHCGCCAHTTALPGRAPIAVERPASVDVRFGASAQAASVAGPRAPPFRPPAA